MYCCAHKTPTLTSIQHTVPLLQLWQDIWLTQFDGRSADFQTKTKIVHNTDLKMIGLAMK